ncbi:MAG: tRNA (guanosine(46)-N7)-methyltransferase TrmB [Treponema sp.]|jgi:tRNA (guanine-N7-)-methyltransferase|nr:tRNA (guanosine(46)-N7)-methyltransferase TrmB [Treponema sp.]
MREARQTVNDPAPDVFRRGIRSYVLRSGRVSAAQRRAYEELSPRYRVPFSAARADYSVLFGNSRPVTIEIGFGMGTATARIARENPERNYLGIEVYKPGIGRLLWEIGKTSLANIRIIEHDAVETLEHMIGGDSTAAFHIFFPDPWPKKRHHKRRLVTRPFTDVLAEKLRSGGYIYVVTDSEDYARRALAELSATAGLRNPCAAGAAGCDDASCSEAAGFAPPRPWRPQTEFEVKGLAKGHKIWELYFVKNE